MTLPRRALAVLPLLAVLAGPAPRSRAEPVGEDDLGDRIERAVTGLRSQRADRRREALLALPPLVEADPAGCRRAVVPLGEIARCRPPTEAAPAVRLLARIPDDRARRVWRRALDGGEHPAVMQAAVDGAAAYADDPETFKDLVETARDRRAPLGERALALEALGAIGGGPARLLLTTPAPGTSEDDTEPWLLAAARALALRRLGGPEARDGLLALLGHAESAPRVHAWEGLVALTGLALPLDASLWERALAGDGPAVAGPLPPDARDRYGPDAPLHVPTYYGIPIARPQSHVVFCLDVSQSMYGRGIEQSRGELSRTLKDFPCDHAFDIVAFNEHVFAFAGELWPAHPVVKWRALAWLEALEPTSYTNLYDAVETAFGYGGWGVRRVEDPSRLDAVFLLSDGAPNRGRHQREDKVVEAIRALSGGRIPVHGVAAGEEVFPLLKRIAGATGGEFRDAFEYE